MKSLTEFIHLETAGASLLLGAAILALIYSNSPWQESYEKVFLNSIYIHLNTFHFQINLKFIINEFLMSIFFLVMGLEIKYEFLEGALNSFSKAILPIISAAGGMALPAIIYVLINYHHLFNLKGWAIPTATDIAFALGVLSLLGYRGSSKAFLTTLAIIDDLIAIIIIALFYTNHIALTSVGISLILLGLLFLLNRVEVNNLVPYCIIGIGLWIALYLAGVHPTLAGIALAFSIPLRTKQSKSRSPLHKLKSLLHPPVALGILPLFAFANAGIPLLNVSIASLQIPIILGIFFSLCIGKQLGIFWACWLAVKLRVAKLPDQIHWKDLYTIAIICGIGFTISLFIGELAFGNTSTPHLNSVKIGVIGGSLVSGLAGYLFSKLSKKT